jgi:hypothetical protein
MRFPSAARIKTVLVLGPMALALSALASNSSYAYDYLDSACPASHYDNFDCSYDYPYGFYDDGGVWWPDNHWRRGDYHRYGHDVDRGLEHDGLGHGGFDRGGLGRGSTNHGGGEYGR